ncbi:MAG: choice-of-anchor L domain-containing protein, partial [Thermomicrobiales bacterium]
SVMRDSDCLTAHRTRPGKFAIGRGLALALLFFATIQFSIDAQEAPATPVASQEIETPAVIEPTTTEAIVTPIAEGTFAPAVEPEPTIEPGLQATPEDGEEAPDTMTELVESAPDDNIEIVDIEDVDLAPALEAELAELTANNEQITVAAAGLSPVMDSPENVVAVLVGDGISFSNIGYVGAPGALGTFTGGTGIIGFEDGIILSTGVVSGVVGPNDRDDSTTNNHTAGDTDLTELVEHPTFDASVLTFDFVPQGNTVVFNYVFTSEEYNEYVNSQFNDVFAFYINGENCATVDGGRVSVNSINGGRPYGTGAASNPDLYVNNDASDGGGAINTQ